METASYDRGRGARFDAMVNESELPINAVRTGGAKRSCHALTKQVCGRLSRFRIGARCHKITGE